jgi:HD-GYP domain-containing protein (c-di-GMP phosphodiesterase class II)
MFIAVEKTMKTERLPGKMRFTPDKMLLILFLIAFQFLIYPHVMTWHSFCVLMITGYPMKPNHEPDRESKIRLSDLIICLSDAMDFIDPAVVNHHKQVAYIASSIGAEMGLPYAKQNELLLAGALHDIGAFTLKERMDTLAFDVANPHLHAEKGCALLRPFEPMTAIAGIIRFHHLPWNHGRGSAFKGRQVPAASHILHLADRVAILINRKHEVLNQVPSICKKIIDEAGKKFMPGMVDAFMGLAAKEYFWLDSVSPSLQSHFSDKLGKASIGLSSGDMMDFSKLFSMIIDFKSEFTATHSSGVATSAEMLSGFLGFTEYERRLMQIAGYLHDLGKLAVPVEILHKPSELKEREFNVIRHHTFYTYRLLETIPSFHIISKWAAFHHERLDGTGYPFHLKEKDLPLGSQIMAVADVFTAVTEDRPYRAGMTRDNAVGVLDSMARNFALNKEIVAILKDNYEEIDTNRKQTQASAMKEYKGMSRLTPLS